jgi:lipid A 3-O-deacylase
VGEALLVSKLHIVALVLTISAACAAPAQAQSLLSPEPLAGIVDEVRLGISAHDVNYTLFPKPWELTLNQIEDVTFDILFTSPDLDAFRWIGSPRPDLGVTINMDGQDSLAHLSLTWQLPIFDSPFYLEGAFGGAVHNGYLTGSPDPTRYSNFGCRLNFYERYGVGAHLSDNVTATLTYEHTSNNGWCEMNQGLSNLGLRVGWKF